MLTAKAQYKLANAEKYFKEHLAIGDHHAGGDYYSEGKQVTGQWFGHGAEKLKLHSDASLDDHANNSVATNTTFEAVYVRRNE